jgi:hypothetical protein
LHIINSRKAAAGFRPEKSPGETTCILSEAPKAKAPKDVHIAAKNELNGKVEPDKTQNSIVDTPVQIQNNK